MKKLLLLSAAIAVGASSFAQKSASINSNLNAHLSQTERVAAQPTVISATNSTAKTTGFSDTFRFETNAQYDSLFIPGGSLYYLGPVLPFDSGFIFGMNAMGFTGFANWYGWGGYDADTTVRILGVRALFGGNYSPNTTKTINIKVWGVDTNQVTLTTTRKLRDLPSSTVLGSMMNISIKNLGIGAGSLPDTVKTHWFTTPISNVTQNFYVGYDMNYTWGSSLQGDTIGLYSNTIGEGWGSGQYYTSGTDTIIFAQSAINDGTAWKDAFMNYGIDAVNFSIIPIWQLSGSNIWPSNVKGITKNNLKLYGNYPNPAVNSTNLQISLAKTTTVTVEISDVQGRVVTTIPAKTYAAGDQLIPVETASLAAGNYVYVIRTGEGDALAAQMTVIK